MARRAILDRIVEERVGLTFVAPVSAVIDRLARSEQLFERMFENGHPRQRRAPSPRRNTGRRRTGAS